MPQRTIDVHTHAFPDSLAASAIRTLEAGARNYPSKAFHDGTVAGLLASMDAAGIGVSFLCSVATRPTQVQRITDWSASIASERIVPFASIHADYEHPEAEAERIASLGIVGLKFHSHFMGCPADDERAIRVARAAAAAGLAMQFHAGHDTTFGPDDLALPVRMRRLHEAVPELRLLVCHLGGWRVWPEVLEQLVGLSVWLDTSFAIGQCEQELLLRIIERHPREYLLFGTDSPWADQSAELAAFRALPLAEDLKSAALWDNALRFAGID